MAQFSAERIMAYAHEKKHQHQRLLSREISFDDYIKEQYRLDFIPEEAQLSPAIFERDTTSSDYSLPLLLKTANDLLPVIDTIRMTYNPTTPLLTFSGAAIDKPLVGRQGIYFFEGNIDQEEVITQNIFGVDIIAYQGRTYVAARGMAMYFSILNKNPNNSGLIWTQGQIGASEFLDNVLRFKPDPSEQRSNQIAVQFPEQSRFLPLNIDTASRYINSQYTETIERQIARKAVGLLH